jgi:hypothetical protein
MKQIESFIDSVYQNVGGNEREIQELKSEMRNHLLEAVHELKSDGKSEQEAIDIAIERFGGENEMRAVVGQLFKAQKVFAKRTLYLAVGFLIVALSIFSFLWQNAEDNGQKLSLITTKISDVLENKEVITPEMKKEIERRVESTNHISEVSIYNSKYIRTEGKNFVSYNTELKNPDYRYKRKLWVPEWLGVDGFFPYGNGDEQWYVEMKFRSFDTLLTVVLFVGIAVYWTLFSIWAITYAYHHRRLNIGWIIVFALFNVLGYLVYRLVERKVHSFEHN